MDENFIVSDNGGQVRYSGSVVERLIASNFNVESLRTADVLRLREWIQFDEVVVAVARQRLVGIADLINEGLTFNVPNALGTTRVEWETVSSMEPAEIDMAGVTQGQSDRINFQLNGIPLPITHRDFTINIRALEAGRKMGTSVDTTQAALAARLVAEALEKTLFVGTTVASVGSKIYGYTTHPNRITGSLSGDWSNTSSTSGTQIIQDIIRMINALGSSPNFMFGPYGLYVPTAAFYRFADDYKTYGTNSILARIQEMEGIKWVKPSAMLTGTNVVLVQMTSDVVDVIDGIQPTTVQWQTEGGFQTKFKVLAIMVPRVKATQTDPNGGSPQSGVAHFS